MNPSRSWPLHTVTVDGRGIAIVRAFTERDAIHAAHGHASVRFAAETGSDIQSVTEDQMLRIAVRKPTEEERQYFLKRALQRRLVAVALP